MNWFFTCKTLDEAKKIYRDLMKKYHPDLGGDTATAQAINAAYDAFCNRYMHDSFTSYEQTSGKTAYANRDTFGYILRQVMGLNVKIEIIGYWIYCFDSYESRTELQGMGFWFSKKHKAWVFSGGKKKLIKSKYSTDDIRNMHGSEVIKEKEESKPST